MTEIASLNIVLEIEEKDQHYLSDLRSAHPDQVEVVKVRRFDAGSDLIHALIILSGITLPVVGKVLIELIRAKGDANLFCSSTRLLSGSGKRFASPFVSFGNGQSYAKTLRERLEHRGDRTKEEKGSNPLLAL